MNLQLNKFKNRTLINLKVRSLKIKKEKSVKEEAEAIEEIVVEVEIDLIESKDPINLKELRVKLKEKADQDKEEGEEIDQELQLLVILERTTKDFKKSGRTMNKKEQEEEVEESLKTPEGIADEIPQETKECFVYGSKVDDFHTLDKTYIFTLNVCATQELYKIIQLQEERIRILEEKLNQLI